MTGDSAQNDPPLRALGGLRANICPAGPRGPDAAPDSIAAHALSISDSGQNLDQTLAHQRALEHALVRRCFGSWRRALGLTWVLLSTALAAQTPANPPPPHPAPSAPSLAAAQTLSAPHASPSTLQPKRPAHSGLTGQAKSAQRSHPAHSATQKTAKRSAKKSAKRATRRVAAAAPSYANRADVQAAAQGYASELNLPLEWVQQVLAQAQRLEAVRRAVLPPPPGGAKDWAAYRARFIEPKRIAAGVAFWHAHAQALTQAEQTSGVPAEIIVGIIGVETFFGQQMGRTRTLDALATLAFDFPPEHPRAAQRQAFFRAELGQFLALAASGALDAIQARGSYAGALGWPQFMPGSWRRWAQDGNADGRIDLLGQPQDAIASVAAYLQAHGYQAGQPTHFAINPPPPGPAREALLAPDIVPSFTAQQLLDQGATLAPPALAHSGLLALVELQMGPSAPPIHLAATANFYAITRYNWSSYYALAVIELGQAVKALK